jgi:hypothetical protein
MLEFLSVTLSPAIEAVVGAFIELYAGFHNSAGKLMVSQYQ